MRHCFVHPSCQGLGQCGVGSVEWLHNSPALCDPVSHVVHASTPGLHAWCILAYRPTLWALSRGGDVTGFGNTSPLLTAPNN